MLMNTKQVMAFLPHRDPFLFIDSVTSVELPEELKGLKKPFKANQLVGGKTFCRFEVRPETKVLEGHFPGHPILPGVVQVEMMAQASAFLMIYAIDVPPEEAKLDVALLGVEKAKFRKPVLPGMMLEISTVLTKVRGPMTTYDAQIHCNGELMSESSFLASLRIL
ncbi:MAG: beta-hydroxyacyl-ACP dehydratase [Bacteriovoracaceae bacterium]|nr:beta-hydroxyacyl-ACP dehydratase [Bacteriovoracaceae bacterium]